MPIPESLYLDIESGRAAITAVQEVLSDPTPRDMLPFHEKVEAKLAVLAQRNALSHEDRTSLHERYMDRWRSLYDFAVFDTIVVSDLLIDYLVAHKADISTQRNVTANSQHIGKLFGAIAPSESWNIRKDMLQTPSTNFTHTEGFTHVDINPSFKERFRQARGREIGCPILSMTVQYEAQKRNLYELAWNELTAQYANQLGTGEDISIFRYDA